MEQPTRFELVINLKTAQALGLTIPPAVLVRGGSHHPVSAARPRLPRPPGRALQGRMRYWLMIALLGYTPAAVQADASGDARAGERKAQLCLLCHKPNNPMAWLPTLEGQTREYLYLQIKAYKEHRRPDTTMQTNVAALSDEDMRDVAEYFATRKPVRAAYALDTDKVAAGRAKAVVLGCGSCHMPDFSGKKEAPRLAGLEPRYIGPQIVAFIAGKRPHPRVDGSSGLTPEDAENLAQYFAQLE